jgi:SAM-dependent methyltransferase
VSSPTRNGEPARAGPDSIRFENAWRRRFGEYAALRDDDAGIAGWSQTGLDARLRKFLSLWRPNDRGGWWLDAGCGAGTYTRVLAQQGLLAVGVDYSLTSLAKARARDSDGARYAVADLRRPPFVAGTFQGVLCFGVTQVLARSDVLVRQLAELVAPEGELWIDGLNRRCLIHAIGQARRKLSRRPMHLRYEASGEIVRQLRAAGFEQIERYWMPIAPMEMRRIQRFFEHRMTCAMLQTLPALGALVSHSFIVHGRRPG